VDRVLVAAGGLSINFTHGLAMQFLRLVVY